MKALESGDDTERFNDQERAVIRFADQLTRNARVDAETIDAVKAFLSEKQLVELAATVGLANWTNRFNEGFEVELP